MEESGGNWLAYAMILAWPLVAFMLYQLWSFKEATAWTILGALLFLPAQLAVKFSMVPAIDKNSVASVSVLLGTFFFGPRMRMKRVPAGILGLMGALAALFIVSPIVTSLLNDDAIVRRFMVIPGVGYYDGVSALLLQCISCLPFLVGFRFFRLAEDAEILLRTLVAAALIYSVPMLIEVRISPQLSSWIYGAFSSKFAVEMRYGGFRPVVFMINGLAAAFFASTAFLAAATLWRTNTKIFKIPTAGTSAYLGILVVLCKSAGALVYAIVVGSLLRWFSPKAQLRTAVLLAGISIMYPMLRMANFMPVQEIVNVATWFNAERAKSLNFRFDQEERLLAHASERFWFGWGRYGRNRVYDEMGNDTSITDGQWILTLGQFGFVGFLAQFGLLTLPVFQAARTAKGVRSHRELLFLCCLSLIVAVSALEQIPNASISAWNWLLAGALLGRCVGIRAAVPSSIPSPSPPQGRIGSQSGISIRSN
ncbi:hypothetical protein [Bradyrhizobium sp. CCBAU 11434]|uniref:hypothetical protein n=1 Tax=Bradyrhizobium sp. CCBAU 11434 TaxID=1630885 RepID=UPI0023055A1E|nr:hypothetical protein [Bradyrhizobium sp. CCBAU 11434]